MKRIILLISCCFGLLLTIPIMACDVCQKQQPRILKNITHGAGPQGQEDYIIIISAAIIVIVTLFLSVKYLIKPGEKSPDHVKNTIIDNF